MQHRHADQRGQRARQPRVGRRRQRHAAQHVAAGGVQFRVHRLGNQCVGERGILHGALGENGEGVFQFVGEAAFDACGLLYLLDFPLGGALEQDPAIDVIRQKQRLRGCHPGRVGRQRE